MFAFNLNVFKFIINVSPTFCEKQSLKNYSFFIKIVFSATISVEQSCNVVSSLDVLINVYHQKNIYIKVKVKISNKLEFSNK